MIQPETGWETYYKNRGSDPRPEMLNALRHVKKSKTGNWALDLGCGNFSDACYLLFNEKQSFMVTAVDPEPSLMDMYEQHGGFAPDQLFFENKKIEEYVFPKDLFNFVCANYSLPWVSKAEIVKIFDLIFDSMQHQGIFSFQLFGEEDDWNDERTEISFYDSHEVLKLISKYELLSFKEKAGPVKLVNETITKRHTLSAILRKS